MELLLIKIIVSYTILKILVIFISMLFLYIATVSKRIGPQNSILAVGTHPWLYSFHILVIFIPFPTLDSMVRNTKDHSVAKISMSFIIKNVFHLN